MAPSAWSSDDDAKLLISMVLASTPRPLTMSEWTDAAGRVTSMGKTVTAEACRQHYAKLKRHYESQGGGGAEANGDNTASRATPKSSPSKRKAMDITSTPNKNEAANEHSAKRSKAAKAAGGEPGDPVAGVPVKAEEAQEQWNIKRQFHASDCEDQDVA